MCNCDRTLIAEVSNSRKLNTSLACGAAMELRPKSLAVLCFLSAEAGGAPIAP